MEEGKASQAITLLETAASHEIGQSSSLERGTLYPAYLCGQAYLQEHNGSAAAVEFQEVLGHPGVVLNFVTGALARLQLERVHAAAGDAAGSKKAYEEFRIQWKDADAGRFLF